MTTPLNEKLQTVKWGNYKLGDIFDILSYKKRFDANKVTIYETGQYPYIVRMGTNNGQRGFINEDIKFLNDGNTISFGQDTATVFYQEKPYFTGDKIKILKPKFDEFGKKNALFFVAAMNLSFKSFSWGSSSFNIKIIKNVELTLPSTPDGQINFAFMESFIAELEAERIAELSAYLKVSGLDDYHLSQDEENALQAFQQNLYSFGEFRIDMIFNQIKQGRRLKKEDQIPGKIPFVMSGVTNTGVIGYVSNPVASFPANSITVDIFGNTFYRNYYFGAGDDTGVYWNDTVSYNSKIMLFFAAAIEKALQGKFSYGKKLRSSQSNGFKMLLPIKSGKPDYQTMELLISAIQKLVIKDVVQYANIKIDKTKQIIAEIKN